jgi:hypothetical protein
MRNVMNDELQSKQMDGTLLKVKQHRQSFYPASFSKKLSNKQRQNYSNNSQRENTRGFGWAEFDTSKSNMSTIEKSSGSSGCGCSCGELSQGNPDMILFLPVIP